MRLRRRVSEGEALPRGYGLAWREWGARIAVCYPVPLNWVAAWIRQGYRAVRRGPREEAERRVFEAGRKAGAGAERRRLEAAFWQDGK